MVAYAAWWRRTRATKYSSHTEPCCLPNDLGEVIFGQVRSDVAVWASGMKQEALWRRAKSLAPDAVWKGHPFEEWVPPQGQVLPRRASIHDVLPRCKLALTASSAVGIEAWLYGCRTNILARPWYAFGECAVRGEVLTEEAVDARMRVLDWFVHCVQVVGPQGLHIRLQED
jgi:hypothetical protein